MKEKAVGDHYRYGHDRPQEITLACRYLLFPPLSGFNGFRPFTCDLLCRDVDAIPNIGHGDPKDQ